MTAPNLAAVLRVPGRLIVDPTDLLAASPYGGTALGMARGVEVRISTRSKLIAAEEWGGVTTEVLYAGETVVLAAVLREWDPDAAGRVFAYAASGAVTGRRVASQTVDAGTRAGTRRTPHKLLFAPNAKDAQPFVYFPAAVPLLDAAARLNLGLDQEAGFGAVWHAVPAADGRVYQIGFRPDLTL
jgi:hypothetical protein